MKTNDMLRLDAAQIWSAALKAVDAEGAVHRFVSRRGRELRIGNRRCKIGKLQRIWVIGAGKAAAHMGRTLEKILGPCLSGGLVVTKYGHGVPLARLTLLESGHPLPDQNSVAAGSRLISFVRSEIAPEDLVFCVLSGGASALVTSPVAGVTWEDKQECTRLLLNTGADIRELNTIRKHLSVLKGGGLARLLAPTRVIALILSDVVGDRLDTIASGPLAPDATTFGDCVEILQRLELLDRVPQSVRELFLDGAAGKIPETPKAGDPAFTNVMSVLVGSNAAACTAAAREARRLGYRPAVITARLEGDNREAARFHMSLAQEVAAENRPVRRPACILSGGETTVKVTGTGKGGRNMEFALACARTLAALDAPGLVASIGTDGTDGPTDAAGALVDNTTLARSLNFGAGFLSESLANNDSYGFFQRLGDLIITGPTGTNVMDLHIILVG
jgi:glycerate 2-kinase